MDNDIEMFLRRRNVKDEIIAKMKRDKIDRYVVQAADDSFLSKYLEVGDCIALKHYCEENSKENASATKRKKDNILCRLRQKISWPGQSKDSDDYDDEPMKKGKQKHMIGNKHAKKLTRIIEIGWVHFKEEDKMYHQVRAKNGGVTRKQEINKNAVKDEILNLAKGKFFKDDKSRLGKLVDFQTDLFDFEYNTVDERETVGEMYERTGINRLRFYLATKKKSFFQEKQGTKLKNLESASEHSDKDDSLKETQVVGAQSGPQNSICEDSSSLELENPDLSCNTSSNIVQFKDDFFTFSEEEDNNSTLPLECSDILAMAAESAGITVVKATGDRQNVFLSDMSTGTSMQLINTDSMSLGGSHSTNTVHMFTNEQGVMHGSAADSPRSPTPPLPEENVRTIRLHRVRIEQEMISIFIDPSILTENLKFNFVDEKGVDASGVSREAYVTFWDEFMTNSCKGEQERIPLVKSSMQKPEWEAVGRILAKGYHDIGVFPLQLSKVFSIAIVFGEEAISSDDLLSSFMNYVAPIEKDALQKALSNNLTADDDDDDYDEFVEVLTRFGSKSIPKGDQVKPALLRIAQKELIQTSKYALDAISSMAQEMLRLKLPSPQSVREMYDMKIPTNRKVIKLLEAQESGEDQDRCFGYLKQYVKALDDSTLRQFLRHVTGADMICVQKIEVHFNNRYGLNRLPVVRTCTPMIELSTTYYSYPDFRAEFSTLLKVHHPLDID